MWLDKLPLMMSANDSKNWFQIGRHLSEYQKSIIKENGISVRRFTDILLKGKDPKLSEFLNICKILNVLPSQVLQN